MPTQAELVELIVQTSGDLPRRAAAHPPMATPSMHVSQLAAMIDHTLLKPEANETQIRQLCAEAREHHFASVCINPTWVELCRQMLFEGDVESDVKVCTVIGFPLGATLTAVKAYEAEQSIRAGAQEVDMVLNIGRLKSDQFLAVYTDIHAIVERAHAQSALVKVILETALLTEDQIVAGCVLAAQAGADFVKTSTGFSTRGASAGDVHMMRLAVGQEVGVKAAGGIRTAGDALEMIAAGATRIGASAGVQILRELASGDMSAAPASVPKEPY